MGIETNKDGAYVPDKETKWPTLKDNERSKVYESHKEKYAGTMAEFKRERIKEKEDYWYNLSNTLKYDAEYKATDPNLKGMPVSMALLLSFKREFNKTYKGKPAKPEVAGKEKEMMMFCLDYLQNAPENIALREKYPNANIDTVPKDGSIKIDKIEKTNESWARWQLQILDKNGNIIFAGFMFPDRFSRK